MQVLKISEKTVSGFRLRLIESGNYIVGITKDIGPRILYLAHSQKPDFNLLGILPDAGKPTTEGFWHSYGGHRLWSSPEESPRSYSMDNQPVDIKIEATKVVIRGNPEPENSTHKEIILDFSRKDSIQVTHKIKNIGRWPIELAAWALSVMRKKGFAIIPIKPERMDKEGLLPDRRITIWPYTDLSDKRIVYSNEYLFLKQDPRSIGACKLGAMVNPNWVAYWVGGVLYVKKFTPKNEFYPDFGCSVEVYSCSDMLEIETLSPIKIIKPSQSILHTEQWYLRVLSDLKPDSHSVRQKLGKLAL